MVPALAGTVYVHEAARGFILNVPPEPERGSQTEFNLSYRKRNALTQFEYGIRYINFVTKFTATDGLADRNTGFRPYASFGVHVGKP